MAPYSPLPPKTPNRHITPGQRNRIFVLKAVGWSRTHIANQEGISHNTVFGVANRVKTRISGRTTTRTGRPLLLNKRDLRDLRRAIKIDPFTSLGDLQRFHVPEVSVDTIRRALRKEGIMHCRALERPYLTEDHAERRFLFAAEHADKDIGFWRRVLFSDETSVQRGDGQVRGWVFRPRGMIFILFFFY